MADWQFETELGIDMPSLNHSLLQTRLVKLIDERFVTLTELSLDLSKLDEEHRSALGASKELKPDTRLSSFL